MDRRRLLRAAAAVAIATLVAACASSAASPPAGAPTAVTEATPAPATAPPPTPVGSSTDAAPCAAPDLAVDVTGDGAGGAILLVIDVTNHGAAPCLLAGPPSSIGLRAGGGNLPLAYQARPDPWPGDTPDAVAEPVVLPSNWKARARAIWRNWCQGPADVSTVWVGLGPQAIDAHPDPELTPPRCDNQDAESTLAGFPFEEDTSGG